MVFKVRALGDEGVHVSAYELLANALAQVALILQVENAAVPVLQIPVLITRAWIVGIAAPLLALWIRPYASTVRFAFV
jgi:hypothetical protein